MYDLYKPLRDELSEHALFRSLRVIWAWMQQLQFGQDFPADIEVPQQVRAALRSPTRGVYEWELAVLAKELIVLAPESGSVDMRSWNRFSSAMNKLKELDNAISGRYEKLFREHIFIEMYRIAHQQFWWQRTLRMDSEVTRYLKIFGAPAVDSILQQGLGVSTHVLFTIGLAVSGHFLGEFELSAPLTFDLYGVTSEQVAAFFARYCRPLADMRVLCRGAESFDENFIYAFNPLLQFPLLSYTAGNEPRVVAPVPRYLIRRFTEGVYYDILGTPGFDAAFGDSYQTYVGEVLAAINTRKSLAIAPEAEYAVGKDRKRTVDWIASDSTGELFIECKTKRLRLEAKIALSDQTPLHSELTKLAEFAVQIYKTLIDAVAGRYPHWAPGGKPLYPVIVTLEEWFVFGHKLDAEIEARIRSEFQSHGAAWERGILGDATTLGRGKPVAVSDPHRFLIDFLPIERRLIRREGISLHSVSYWSDVLRAWVGVPEKMIVRYDPRNLSRIYLLGPDGRYYDIPYRELRRPPITLWEQRLALKRLHEEGRSHVDESAIFRTIETMRKIADEAVTTTKTLRRQQERRLRLIQGGRTDPGIAVVANAPISEVEDDSQDNSVAQVRMLPFEEWS